LLDKPRSSLATPIKRGMIRKMADPDADIVDAANTARLLIML